MSAANFLRPSSFSVRSISRRLSSGVNLDATAPERTTGTEPVQQGRETVGFGYQYPSSTQPHCVAVHRQMSSCIQSSQSELAKKNPAYAPLSAHNPRFESNSDAEVAHTGTIAPRARRPALT